MHFRRKYKRYKYAKLNGIFTTVIPNSKYPSTYADLPDDMDDWGCSTWIIYYKRNKAAGGKQYAIDLINLEFDRIGSFSNAGYCKYDCDWINYFRNEGFDVNSFISDLYCDATGIITDATGTIKNITGGANKLTRYILPITFIGLGLIGYDYYLKTHK